MISIMFKVDYEKPKQGNPTAILRITYETAEGTQTVIDYMGPFHLIHQSTFADAIGRGITTAVDMQARKESK